MATHLDSLGENQFVVVKDINHPRQELLIDANNLNNDSVPYKSYVALLTQTGTNAPVATVLENTLGGTPVWSYSDTGLYLLTLTGAWVTNKTVIIPPANSNNVGGTILPTHIQVFGVNRNNANVIQLTTGKQEIATGIITATNGYLYSPNMIEIRVYN
jgi:hypothetical protein